MSCLYCDSVRLTFELLIYERHCLRTFADDALMLRMWGCFRSGSVKVYFSVSIVHFNNIGISGYRLKENTLHLCHENKPGTVLWVGTFFSWRSSL